MVKQSLEDEIAVAKKQLSEATLTRSTTTEELHSEGDAVGRPPEAGRRGDGRDREGEGDPVRGRQGLPPDGVPHGAAVRGERSVRRAVAGGAPLEEARGVAEELLARAARVQGAQRSVRQDPRPHRGDDREARRGGGRGGGPEVLLRRGAERVEGEAGGPLRQA